MPSSSLAEYLAKNYLTADPAPMTDRPKKKRKKTKAAETESQGLIIADDDPPDLRSTAAPSSKDNDEYGPVVAGGRSAEFRKAKKSNWKTIGSSTNANTGTDTAGGSAGRDEADAILADAMAEEDARRAEETIYRDASGRIINVAMKRAEARRMEEEKRIKEAEAKEALMGDVQRAERESRRAALEEAKVMPLARTADDEELNEELKGQTRWNDPAAQFLTRSTGSGKSKTGKPLYKGAFQPNRYGIRPGHRWDGVDRSNGFEKEWFAARNKKGRLEALEYEWQMDE